MVSVALATSRRTHIITLRQMEFQAGHRSWRECVKQLPVFWHRFDRSGFHSMRLIKGIVCVDVMPCQQLSNRSGYACPAYYDLYLEWGVHVGVGRCQHNASIMQGS